MLKQITLGRFYPTDSAIHRLDPRVKLILTVLLMVSVFSVAHLPGYLLILIFIFAASRLAKVPFRMLLNGLRPMLFILILTFLVNALLSSGENMIFELGIIRISAEGLKQAVHIVLRLIFLVTGTSMLTLTTTPVALCHGLESLLAPLKYIRFPVQELAMMVTIALRFLPILQDEAVQIQRAQTARGADFESGNLFARMKAYMPILIPLFASAFRHAANLATAMESRCYRSDVRRTHLNVLKPGRNDAVACIACCALLALILLEGRLG